MSRTRILLLRSLLRQKRVVKLVVLAFFLLGYAWPERLVVPVAEATPADWNHGTFRYHPWGRSGVHKGIDIFARHGAPVLAATSGLVLHAGTLSRGGKVIAIAGPRWCVHYYAHLDSQLVRLGQPVRRGQRIGTVGNTGNVASKPPHLHYSILTPVPYPWRLTGGPQGWRKMFFLDPHEKLMAAASAAEEPSRAP